MSAVRVRTMLRRMAVVRLDQKRSGRAAICLLLTLPFLNACGLRLFGTGNLSSIPAANLTTITGTDSVADGAQQSIITVTMKRIDGEPYVGERPLFRATDTGNTNAGYESCTVSDDEGVSTCFLTSTKAETKTLQLLYPVQISGGRVAFTHGVAAKLTSTRTIVGAFAGATLGAAPLIEIQDINGNRVTTGPDASAAVTMSLSVGSGSLMALVGVTKSASAGVVDFTSHGLNFEEAGSKRLQASKADTTGSGGTAAFSLSSSTNAFTISPAAASPAQSYITVLNDPVAADGVATAEVAFQIRDEFRNPISGTVPAFTATGTGNLIAVASATDSNGESSTTIRSTVAELKTLTMSAPATLSSLTDTVTFVATLADPANSTVVAQAGTPIADGVDATIVDVTLLASDMSPVQGVTPAILATGTGNANYSCGPTDVNGQTTCTFTSTRAETKTVRLSSPITKVGNTTTFVHGPAHQVVYVTQPSNGIVNLPLSTQPSVEIQDAQGNRVTSGVDATADVTMSLQSGTGVLAGTLTRAAVGGVANFSSLGLNGSLSGVKTLRATKANTTGGGGTTAKTGDSASFTLVGNSAPVVTNVIAVNSNSMPTPPQASDLTTAGGTVYVRWKAVAGSGGTLAATPMRLEYTTDDSSGIYTVIDDDLLNSANMGCSFVPVQESGCYRWAVGVPASGFLRVRVVATDVSGLTGASSSALNIASQLKILAGDLDSGLGLSASNFAFLGSANQDPATFVVARDGTIYVRDLYRGVLRVNAATSAVERLAPMGATTSGEGDGGAIGLARFRSPTHIALDWEDRLLILDYDRLRQYDPVTDEITTLIGCVNTPCSQADDEDPLSFTITPPTTDYLSAMNTEAQTVDRYATRGFTFYPLKDGRIFFQAGGYTKRSGNGWSIFYFDPNGLKIKKVATPNGTGYYGNVTTNIQSCVLIVWLPEYNLSTQAITRTLATVHRNGTGTADAGCDTSSGNFTPLELTWPAQAVAATHPESLVAGSPAGGWGHNGLGFAQFMGRDGKVYGFQRDVARIRQLAFGGTTWTTLVGHASAEPGNCADDTLATSCRIEPNAVFVQDNGTIYWMERGMIRLLDSNSRVQTIYGRGFSRDSNLLATSDRLGKVSRINYWKDGSTWNFGFVDRNSYRIREFPEDGTVFTLAGNGSSSFASTSNLTAATETGLSMTGNGQIWDDFVYNPANGDAYGHFATGAGAISYLTRSLTPIRHWQRLSSFNGAGGSVGYMSVVAEPMSQTSFGVYRPRALAWVNGQVIYAVANGNDTTPTDRFLIEVNPTNSTWSFLAGKAGADASFSYATSGAVLSSRIPNLQSTGRWAGLIYDDSPTTPRYLTLNGGGAAGDFIAFEEGGNFSSAGTHSVGASSIGYSADRNTFYFCGTNDFKLYQKKMSEAGQPQTEIALPVPGLQCTGRSLLYLEERGAHGTLVFPASLNGLHSIVEYALPED